MSSMKDVDLKKIAKAMIKKHKKALKVLAKY